MGRPLEAKLKSRQLLTTGRESREFSQQQQQQQRPHTAAAATTVSMLTSPTHRPAAAVVPAAAAAAAAQRSGSPTRASAAVAAGSRSGPGPKPGSRPGSSGGGGKEGVLHISTFGCRVYTDKPQAKVPPPPALPPTTGGRPSVGPPSAPLTTSGRPPTGARPGGRQDLLSALGLLGSEAFSFDLAVMQDRMQAELLVEHAVHGRTWQLSAWRRAALDGQVVLQSPTPPRPLTPAPDGGAAPGAAGAAAASEEAPALPRSILRSGTSPCSPWCADEWEVLYSGWGACLPSQGRLDLEVSSRCTQA